MLNQMFSGIKCLINSERFSALKKWDLIYYVVKIILDFLKFIFHSFYVKKKKMST